MKSKNLILSALILFLGLLFIPAIHAGDGQTGPSSSCRQSNRVHAPLYGEVVRAQSPCLATCCERRCSRLMGMVYRRGCLCPEVARALQPARSFSYLSNHYPPYRYGW